MKKIIFSLTAIILLSLCATASAHSGRTDEYGGHWDHSTGTYHYHSGNSSGQNNTSNQDTHNIQYASEAYESEFYDDPKQYAEEHYDKGYKEGYQKARKEYEPPKSAFRKFMYNINIFLYENFLLVLIILIITLYAIRTVRKIKTFHSELRCTETDRYPASAFITERNKEHTFTAEVKTYTKTDFHQTFFHGEEILDTTKYYVLNHLLWPNGQPVELYKKTDKGYVFPEVKFNRQMRLESRAGEHYLVMIKPQPIDLSKEQTKILAMERRKITDFRKKVKDDIDKMFNDNRHQNEIFSDMFADYEYKTYMQMVDDLIAKARPAPKAAETIRQVSKELKKTRKAYLNLKYKLNMYGIEDVEDITLEDAKYLQAAQEYLSNKKIEDNKE